MNNKKSIKSDSLLLIVSGLVVVLLIVLNIFSINKIKETSENIKTETTKLDENKHTLEKLKKLELIRPELESANEILIKQIPEEPLESGLLEYIQNLSNNNKNNFVEIKFEEREEKSNLSEMPFVFIVTGRYSSLLGLLGNLANGERLIRIDEIRIESMGNAKGLINTTIKANAFYK